MDAFEAHSVTFWIDALHENHPDAIEELWDRYFQRLTRLADTILGERQRLVDGEDIAVSVFHSLSQAARHGGLQHLPDRDALWRLLVTMTRRKIIDDLRHELRAKRGGGNVRGESVFQPGAGAFAPGINAVADEQPTPQFLCIMDEEFRQLISLLNDDTLRDVAVSRMEGCTTAEIATRTGLSPRSVERKLGLIRERWLAALKPLS